MIVLGNSRSKLRRLPTSNGVFEITTLVFSSSIYLHVVGARVKIIASGDVSGSNVGAHVPFEPRPGMISPFSDCFRQKHTVLLSDGDGP